MTPNRVLVAGAGPVGLVAAAALAAEGIPVLVIEAERDLPDGLRASTFHPPTLDMLQRFGVVEAMVEQGLVCPTWQFRDRAAGPVATFDHAMIAGDTAHPYRPQCEQWRLTRLLRDRLAADPQVEFLYDARAAEVTQDSDGVTLTVERPDGHARCCAGRGWSAPTARAAPCAQGSGHRLRGADHPGASTTLSTPFPFHFPDHVEDLTNIAYIRDRRMVRVAAHGVAVARAAADRRERAGGVHVSRRADREERMQQVLPTAVYEIRHRTAYRVHERVADRYVAGRVLLPATPRTSTTRWAAWG